MEKYNKESELFRSKHHIPILPISNLEAVPIFGFVAGLVSVFWWEMK